MTNKKMYKCTDTKKVYKIRSQSGRQARHKMLEVEQPYQVRRKNYYNNRKIEGHAFCSAEWIKGDFQRENIDREGEIKWIKKRKPIISKIAICVVRTKNQKNVLMIQRKKNNLMSPSTEGGLPKHRVRGV